MLYAVGRLRDLLIEDKKHLQKLSDPVDELEKKLTLLEDLFEDVTAVRRDGRTSAIVDLCDQMMDDVDDYVAVRITTKTRFGLREKWLRPKLLLKIEQLDSKIADLVNTHKGKTILEVGKVSLPRSFVEIPRLDEQDFVGRGEEIKNLVSCLKEGNDNWVVSICGMGGLGKTTLAKKVYKHEDVRRHFDRLVFLCLGQECNVEATLRRILQELVPGKKDHEISSMSAADVEDEIRKVLSENRSLVLLDDIWTVEAWKGLSGALSTIQVTGGKVFLTTRNREVAELGNNIVHQLNCLSDEESWELLQKKARTRIYGRGTTEPYFLCFYFLF